MSQAATKDQERDQAKILAKELARPKAPATGRASAAEFVKQLERKYADSDTEEFLRSMIVDEFPGRIALVSSFGTEAAVLLDFISRIKRDLPVIFIDTGMHFAQTLDYREKVSELLNLTDVRGITPDPEDIAAQDPDETLWQKDTDKCCNIRKVKPLDQALQGFDVWINGRKQIHGGERIRLPRLEASGKFIKVNPLAHWTREDVDRAFERSGLPRHPMAEQGYLSIGCWPCTVPAQGSDIRSGRWMEADKTECGIHGPLMDTGS